jgi:hypothetical protein
MWRICDRFISITFIKLWLDWMIIVSIWGLWLLSDWIVLEGCSKGLLIFLMEKIE